MRNNAFQTYTYELNPKDSFGGMPEINGRKCVAMEIGDVPAQRDEAMSLLAKFHCGDIEPIEVAEFLKKHGYEHTYMTLIQP